MSQKSPEERLDDLQTNVEALNRAMTDTAKAFKDMLAANGQNGDSEMATTLDGVLASICPFPPGC